MVEGRLWRWVGRAVVLVGLVACGGCSTQGLWLIHPRGPVADASVRAWIVDTAATFLVIGPATLLVAWALWRYRRVNGRGRYVPGWSHSVPLELLCWGFPFVVVVGLGYYSLNAALATDPAAPGAMAAGTSADADKPPINIDVVTTDWQWLFIYPDQHIAVANKLVLPAHTPVRFRLTSSTVATDFFIPQLTGQIDVMPGMTTGQGLIADAVGTYEGFATDYNGPGFSWMRFQAHVVSDADYAAWVAGVKANTARMDSAAFVLFATPTINDHETTIEYGSAQDGLFERVMGDVMAGVVYPTPPNMTEKKAREYGNGRQQKTGVAPLGRDQ